MNYSYTQAGKPKRGHFPDALPRNASRLADLPGVGRGKTFLEGRMAREPPASPETGHCFHVNWSYN